MLISRTPLRVSFLGGGTDLPWYFEKYGGCVVSMAINKHIYITGRPMFEEDSFLLKYSKIETTSSVHEIQHPIIREILKYFKVNSMDIGISSDFSAGSGMGSSSAFTVGMIKLVSRFVGKSLTNYQIAELACRIEIEILKEPIGKQDQFSSTFGGLNLIEFKKNGAVVVKEIAISQASLDWLNSSLYLVPIGKSRSASKLLSEQAKKANGEKEMINALHSLRDLTVESFTKIERDPSYLSEILNLSWKLKILSNPSATNDSVNNLISLGLESGASGAKLLGAGQSGFVLFIVQSSNFKNFESTLTSMKHRIIPIELDPVGATLLYDSEKENEL
jgi:D-glycero-alpha-D-manno-heptose-7-phosphate kinase